MSICIRGWGGDDGCQNIFAMDQSNQEVEACGKLHPSQARSQDFILGGGSEHAKRPKRGPYGVGCREGESPPPRRSAEALTFH